MTSRPWTAGIALALTAEVLWAAAPNDVPVTLSAWRRPEKKRQTHLGLDRVEAVLDMARALHAGGLKLHYRAYVDPAQDDKPADRGWGNVAMGCMLGPTYANGQWDRWHFLEAVLAAGGKTRNAVRQDRLRGFYVLEEGARGLADVVWRSGCEPSSGSEPMSANTAAMRVMKLPDAPTWAFFEVCSLRPEDRLTTSDNSLR